MTIFTGAEGISGEAGQQTFRVYFGDQLATDVKEVTPSSISCVAPPHSAGSVKVVVTIDPAKIDGVSVFSGNIDIGTFTYK